jgi:hypothetical protein
MRVRILHSDWPDLFPVGSIQELIPGGMEHYKGSGWIKGYEGKKGKQTCFFCLDEVKAVDETPSTIREFSTGATRDNDVGKLDYEGFLSPLVIERYCQYLHKHRIQSDGKLRDSDNWQRGIEKDVYMKSAFRHFIDMWKGHRKVSFEAEVNIEDAICAVMFNCMGYLFEILREKR